MKSTQRTMCSFVPCANAGARPAETMVSIPPVAATAAPVILRNVRRPSVIEVGPESRDSLICILLKEVGLRYFRAREVTMSRLLVILVVLLVFTGTAVAQSKDAPKAPAK